MADTDKIKFTRYISKSGKPSGVSGFYIGEDYILVKFTNSEIYRYSEKSAGKTIVDKMKQLAAARKGLSTFIARNRPGFEYPTE